MAKNFSENFAEIDTSVRSAQFLKRNWDEFNESVIPPSTESGHYSNTLRPAVYFNISSTGKSAKLPLHFWQAIPNYFVGFGLLFTFLGLAAALNFASAGVASSDINEAQTALKDLLHAATFKFLTSIVGLFASILFSMAYKWRTGVLQKKLSEFCDALEKGLVYCTPQAVALEQLAELRRQTPVLEYFKTDFAVSVASALQSKMNESLPDLFKNSLQPLAEELKRLTGSLGQMNMDGLERMTSQFTEKLQSGAGSEMKAITQTLGNMQQTMLEVAEQMRTSGEKAGGSLERATTQLEAIIAQAGNGFGSSMQSAAADLEKTIAQAVGQIQTHLSEAGQGVAGQLNQASSQMDGALKPFTQQIEKFSTVLENFGAEAERQQHALKGMTGDILQATTEIGRMAETLQAAALPVSQTAAQMENTARSIQATSSSIEQVQRQLNQLFDTIQSSNQQLQETWAGYQKRFETVDEDLANAFQALTSHSQTQLDNFKKYALELDGSLQKALTSLASGIEQMVEAIEDMAEIKKAA